MLAAVETALPADIFIAAAAVADWRTSERQAGKIKKKAGGPPTLELVENPDILKTVSARKTRRPTIVAGFAAETSDLLRNAKAKLKRKGCDLIVANDVSPEEGVMGGMQNTVHIISDAKVESWPRLAKEEVATRLMDYLAARLSAKAEGRRR